MWRPFFVAHKVSVLCAFVHGAVTLWCTLFGICVEG